MQQGNSAIQRIMLFAIGLLFIPPIFGIPKIIFSGWMSLAWEGSIANKFWLIGFRLIFLATAGLCIYMAVKAEE